MLAVVLALSLAVPSAAPEAPPRADESAATVRSAIRAVRRGFRARPAVTDAERARLVVVVPELSAERRATLEGAGLVIEVPPPGVPAPRWRDGVAVQGLATPAVRAAVAGLPFVRAVEPVGEARRNVGAVETAGTAIHGVGIARNVVATDGSGITVGVISDGVDGFAASAASGDLPADLGFPAIAGLPAPSGAEGTALLEILHDVAPGARLFFAPAHTSVEMVVAIDGLAAAGVQVVLDDLVFTDEPKFEDGPIAQAARRFTAAGGVYVTAAGNYARSHYYAPYVRGAGRTFEDLAYPALHRFAGGDFGNGLRIPPGGDILAVLQWNNPFGRAGDDFDLILATRTSGGDVVLGASTAEQTGAGHPLEAIRYANATGATQEVYLAVPEFRRVTAASALRLNLIVFSGALLPLEYGGGREAIFGHAAVADVLSVAAADAADPSDVERFSSNGPATVFFPVRSVRQAPRLTAVDGVETAVGRRGGFGNPFFGTSAAAPHVAGCAALLRAAGASAATTAASLTTTAADLAPAGFDVASGAGLLDCAAAARLATGRATAPAIDTLTADFDGGAGVAVQAAGHDVDGDARTGVVSVLDANGDELATGDVALTAAGTGFTATARFQAAALARARQVRVSVRDATGLEGGSVAALVCPGDASLGDALCGVGDLLALLGPEAGARARRAEGKARAAARALARAGRSSDRGHAEAVRRQVRVAAARLARVARLAGRLAVGGEGAAVAARAQALAQRLREG